MGRDHGAAMVELAITLPLLVMLLLGMASTGIAFNHDLSLTHAAREAGRYGATLPVTNFASMQGWLDEVAARALDDATGSLGPSTPGFYVCVAYVHPNGLVAIDSTSNRIDDGSGPTYGGAQCFNDGRPPEERRVQIKLARETDFNALVFSRTLTVGSEATSRFEPGGL